MTDVSKLSTKKKENLDFNTINVIADSYERFIRLDAILFGMTGDLASSAVLSKLRYWFSKDEYGNTRVKINRFNKLWLAKKDEDWLEDAYVTKKQVKRIKKDLIALGLVETRIMRFNGDPTTHWHLNKDRFVELYNEQLQKKITERTKGTTPCENDSFKKRLRKVQKGQNQNDKRDKTYKHKSYTHELKKESKPKKVNPPPKPKPKIPEPGGSSSHSPEAKRLSSFLFQKIKIINPKAKKPNFNTWHLEMDRLLRLDKRDSKEVEKLINWIFDESDFWYKNIHSPGKLRKQYDAIYIQATVKRNKNKKRTINKQKEGELFDPTLKRNR